MTTVAMIAAGVGSAGGVTLLAARVIRGKRQSTGSTSSESEETSS
jgi:hypothetical protein